jgi:hypothetical protein
MNWNMTGAELRATLAAPVAVPATIPYPNASPALGAVLASIVSLSAEDQARLIRAIGKARPAKPLRLAGSAFSSWEDWWPVCRAARARASADLGARWDLDASTLHARIPSAWANIKLAIGGTKHGPRDIHMPAAKYWPGGVLPYGPEYAARGPVDGRKAATVTRLRAPALELAPVEWDIDLAEAAD